MADEVTPAEQPPKRHLLRKAFWLFAVGLGVLILINLLFPDLDLSTEDRIALIRVEGVILDSQTTIGELKRFSENPSIKAIVIRIDSPGGGVVRWRVHGSSMEYRNGMPAGCWGNGEGHNGTSRIIGWTRMS